MESIFNKRLSNLVGNPLRRSFSSIKIQVLIPAASLKRNPNIFRETSETPKSTSFLFFFTEYPWWLPLRPNCFQYRSSRLKVFCKIFLFNFPNGLFMCYFKFEQETVRILTIAMICSNLASYWKIQDFWRPIYNPVKHLWWSFYWKKIVSRQVYSQKSPIVDARLGSKYILFIWSILHYKTLKICFFFKYFTSFKSSIMLLYIYSLNHMTYEILFRCLKQKRLLATY